MNAESKVFFEPGLLFDDRDRYRLFIFMQHIEPTGRFTPLLRVAIKYSLSGL
jgi:hypothetical protein